jgi:hypothetical protein
MELAKPGIALLIHKQIGHRSAKRGRELETVSAGAGIDEHAFRDLSDHRLPIRADVVQACPTTSELRLAKNRHPRGNCLGQRKALGRRGELVAV